MDNFNQLGSMNPSLFQLGSHILSMLTTAGMVAMYFQGNNYFSNTEKLENPGGVGEIKEELKFRSPEIKKFNGRGSEWLGWKNATKNVFMSTGYDFVLLEEDIELSETCKKRNKIAYTLLSQATEDGAAGWIVDGAENQMDGRIAWRKLIEHYDGKHVRTDVATGLRNTIHTTIMVPGSDIEMYTNTFMRAFRRLQKIEGLAMSEDEAKDIMLWNVHDPSYSQEIVVIRSGLCNKTLENVITELKQRSMELDRTRAMNRKIRRVHGLSIDTPDVVTSYRPKRQKTEGMESLPPVVKLNKKGLLIMPRNIWENLKSDHKDFIITYNRAKKHNDDLPTCPPGTTIEEPDMH